MYRFNKFSLSYPLKGCRWLKNLAEKKHNIHSHTFILSQITEFYSNTMSQLWDMFTEFGLMGWLSLIKTIDTSSILRNATEAPRFIYKKIYNTETQFSAVVAGDHRQITSLFPKHTSRGKRTNSKGVLFFKVGCSPRHSHHPVRDSLPLPSHVSCWASKFLLQ